MILCLFTSSTLKVCDFLLRAHPYCNHHSQMAELNPPSKTNSGNNNDEHLLVIEDTTLT